LIIKNKLNVIILNKKSEKRLIFDFFQELKPIEKLMICVFSVFSH